MITLDELHKAPTLLRKPYYREAMEIIAGRRAGKVHSKAIWRKLQQYHLVDSKRKPTLIGIRALDSK